MANEDDIERLRQELNERMTAVSVELMGAFGSLENHGKRFDQVDARLDKVDARLDRVDGRLDKVDWQLGQITSTLGQFGPRFEHADNRLTLLDAKVDTRFSQLDKKVDDHVGRLDTKLDVLADRLDRRFGWQAFLLFVLGAVTVLQDQVGQIFGL